MKKFSKIFFRCVWYATNRRISYQEAHISCGLQINSIRCNFQLIFLVREQVKRLIRHSKDIELKTVLFKKFQQIYLY